jgi:hypothetical protein
MMKRIQYLTRITATLVASLCLGLLLVGCGSSTNNSTANTANSNTANSNTAATTNSGASRTSETPATASTGGGEKIGVPACDEYIEKYEACLKDKVPAAGQAQLKASLETMRNSWRTAAANPQTKAGLNTGCQAALNAAKQSMSAYGCAW